MHVPLPARTRRALPYVAMYVCGAVSGAGVMIVGDGASRGVVTSAAAAASLPALLVGAPRGRAPESPMPAAVAEPAPTRVAIAPVVFSLADDGRPPAPVQAVAPDASRPLAASGVVLPLAAAGIESDREVDRPSARERPVASRSAPGVALEVAEVRSTLASHMPALRRCYERASRRQGFGTEERIQLELSISGGAVQSVDVTGASTPALGACVTSVARTWRFPRGSARVALPIRLRPLDR